MCDPALDDLDGYLPDGTPFPWRGRQDFPAGHAIVTIRTVLTAAQSREMLILMERFRIQIERVLRS